MQTPSISCLIIGSDAGLYAYELSNYVKSDKLEGYVDINGVDQSHKECVIFLTSKQLRNDEVATVYWCPPSGSPTMITTLQPHDMSKKTDISCYTKSLERPTSIRLGIVVVAKKRENPTSPPPIKTAHLIEEISNRRKKFQTEIDLLWDKIDIWKTGEGLGSLRDTSKLEEAKQESSKIKTQLMQDLNTLDGIVDAPNLRPARREEVAAIELCSKELIKISNTITVLIQQLKDQLKEDATVQATIQQLTQEKVFFNFYNWKTNFRKKRENKLSNQKDTERLYHELVGLAYAKLNLKLPSVPRLAISSTPLEPHTTLLDPTIITIGTYHSGTNTITVCIDRHYDEVSATIMHELMHAYLVQAGIYMEAQEDVEGICELTKKVLYEKLVGEQVPVAGAFMSNVERYKWPYLKAERAFHAVKNNFSTFLTNCKSFKRLDKI